MNHLRVELQAVNACRVGHSRKLTVGGGCDRLEAIRQFEDPVPVAHPYALLGRGVVEQRPRLDDVQRGGAIFPMGAGDDAAAQVLGDELQPVADTQDWNVQIVNAASAVGCGLVVDTGRTAAQDDTGGVDGANLGRGQAVTDDLAVNIQLADAAGDQLGVLRAEIEDDDFLMDIVH